MKSMTGYGRGSAPLGEGRVDLELRSLNRRFLEVRARAPRALGDLAVALEQLVRERLRRGRVEVQITLEGATGWRVTLDRDLARETFRALAEIRDDLTPGEPLPLTVLAGMPDLFVPARDGGGERILDSVRQAFYQAADHLDEMRSAEGATLARDLSTRLVTVRRLLAGIHQRVPNVLARHRARLRERMTRLLADAAPHLDESRLEQEVILLADRSDVTEELTRIESHCEQLAKLLEAEGEVGRRIEFLLQELSREANTIGAKSQDADVAHLVIDLKVEIERMREQSQNIE